MMTTTIIITAFLVFVEKNVNPIYFTKKRAVANGKNKVVG